MIVAADAGDNPGGGGTAARTRPEAAAERETGERERKAKVAKVALQATKARWRRCRRSLICGRRGQQTRP